MLGPDELERYARHIVLREVGGPGQARSSRRACWWSEPEGLARRRCFISRRPASAPSASSMTTPWRCPTCNGRSSTARRTSARRRWRAPPPSIRRLNPHVAVEMHPRAARCAANALELIGRYDIVADGSDNFATRYLVSDACFLARQAAGHRRRSAPSTARSRPSARMSAPPTARPIRPIAACFRNRRRPAPVPACAEAGILGALAGVIGSMMALEVIREIVGFGEGLVGRLLMVDARSMRFETLAMHGTRPIRYRASADHPGFVGARCVSARQRARIIV